MKLDILEYVIIIVDDMDLMLDFYMNTLGIELSHRAGEFAQMNTGTTRLGFFTRKAMSRTIGKRLKKPLTDSQGFEIGFKVEDVDTLYVQLLDQGVEGAAEPTDRPWGQRTAYIYDPESNLIELAQDKDQ